MEHPILAKTILNDTIMKQIYTTHLHSESDIGECDIELMNFYNYYSEKYILFLVLHIVYFCEYF